MTTNPHVLRASPSESPASRLSWRVFATVIMLLLTQFALRSVNITAQYAFMDEGFHAERAALVWQFKVNPGQFSDGKLLLYFWQGLFSGSPQTALFTSRVAVALVSLLSGAGLFLIGRWMFSAWAAVAALAVYCVLPLTLYHERMALADPFAAVFSTLLAWRCLVFAKHPRLREGLILGVLLGLATLAKLTLILLPVLPFLAAILYTHSATQPLRIQVGVWLRRYVPPLLLAYCVALLLWTPVLIPAFLARNTSTPFMLIDTIVLTGEANVAAAIVEAWTSVIDFTGSGLMIAVGTAAVYLSLQRGRLAQHTAFLAVWSALLIVTWFSGGIPAPARYAVPAAVPILLILAGACDHLWRRVPRLRVVVRVIMTAGALLWLITLALPFDYADLAVPSQVPLTGINHRVFVAGPATADPTIKLVGQQLNRLPPTINHIYADWRVCRLLYFYTNRPLECLTRENVGADLSTRVNRDLKTGERGYVVITESVFGVQASNLPDVCVEAIQKLTRPSGLLAIWRVRRGPCGIEL